VITWDFREIDRFLDQFVAQATARAQAGLAAGARDMQTAMRQTSAYNDDSGATRAGTVAYVVGPGISGAAELAAAVRAVEGENPGHSATAGGTLAGDVGVVATIPTDYQRYLESERAGQNAVLAPALAAFADELTARVAEGR
jgi:hypothetical protein